MIRGGLGWGNLPEHMLRDDLASGRLVAIQPEAWGRDEHTLVLSLIHRPETTFGPAHRWLIERIGVLCAEAVAPPREASPAH
jgi:DNA-binding transcriptional LysR family regulator